MKMLAKAGAYFLPIAVPLVCKYVLSLNWKSFRSNVSSSRVRINLSGLFFVVEACSECLFDGGNALLKRYVGVERFNIEMTMMWFYVTHSPFLRG